MVKWARATSPVLGVWPNCTLSPGSTNHFCLILTSKGLSIAKPRFLVRILRQCSQEFLRWDRRKLDNITGTNRFMRDYTTRLLGNVLSAQHSYSPATSTWGKPPAVAIKVGPCIYNALKIYEIYILFHIDYRVTPSSSLCILLFSEP